MHQSFDSCKHAKNHTKALCCDPDEEKAKQDPSYHLKTTNLETRETLAELYKDYKGDQLLAATMKEPEAKKTDKLNTVRTFTRHSPNLAPIPI